MPSRRQLQRPAATNRPPEQRAHAAGFRRLAGVDEAGRGPWAGPVVAAAVILRTQHLPVRIDDSKRLTPSQRERAFDVILRHADVGVGIVCADEIDRHNILRATFLAMQHAVHDLSAPPDLVLVDGSLAPPLEPPCWPVVHGDACSYPIACASIIAKVTRDRLMAFYHRLLPDYAFDQHKGYGTAQHLEALQRHGPSILHRMTFRPVTMAASVPHESLPVTCSSASGEGAVRPASCRPSGQGVPRVSEARGRARPERRASAAALGRSERLDELPTSISWRDEGRVEE